MSEKNFKINFCPVVLEPGRYRGKQGYTGQNSTILTIFAVGQCESKFSIFKVTRFGCLRARRPLRWWSSVLLIFSMTLESEAWNHRIVGVTLWPFQNLCTHGYSYAVLYRRRQNVVENFKRFPEVLKKFIVQLYSFNSSH